VTSVNGIVPSASAPASSAELNSAVSQNCILQGRSQGRARFHRCSSTPAIKPEGHRVQIHRWTIALVQRETPAVPDLNLQALCKHFIGPDGQRIEAVRSASLEVAHRELLAIVGPSASGKTTLLRLIAGLETVDRGRVQIAGADVSAQPPSKRNLAMVFQMLALYPHLTAAQNIGLGLRLRGTARNEVDQRVRGIAGRLEITSSLDRRPSELSAGQRQRVALARALIRKPDILLLDEPFSHLDAPLRRQLCRELRTLHDEFQLTSLLVTHNIAEAEALGHRVAVMHRGRIEQVDSVEELRAKPATPFVAEFLLPGLI
jgi:multiple sugar transport system ATP-binding protein